MDCMQGRAHAGTSEKAISGECKNASTRVHLDMPDSGICRLGLGIPPNYLCQVNTCTDGCMLEKDLPSPTYLDSEVKDL